MGRRRVTSGVPRAEGREVVLGRRARFGNHRPDVLTQQLVAELERIVLALKQLRYATQGGHESAPARPAPSGPA